MKMKIASIEDSHLDRELFKKTTKEISKNTNTSFAIDYFESGEDFLKSDTSVYQVAFMDIELPNKNGMEIAKELRKVNSSTLLIFLTNYIQYAVEGYEVDAFDYILKPINYYSFYMKFQRLLNKLAISNSKQISIHTDNGKTFINSNDIRYIEIMGHEIVILSNKGNISTSGILNNLENELREYGFSRSSASTLVNMSYIESIYKDDVVLKTGEHIHIGRTKKKQFLTDVAKFIGKK